MNILIKEEIKRYLGLRKSDDAATVDSLIDELYGLLSKSIEPKLISGEFDIKKEDDGYALSGADLVFKGKLIEKTLSECDSLVLFAATLTSQADNLLREYSAKDMHKTVILNACMTAYLECFADSFEAKIKDDMLKRGKNIKNRISCGYGDFDIGIQPDIIKLLKADKYLGLTVTEANMLIPEKSITALIGAGGGIKDNDKRAHCGNCTSTCNFRKQD